MRAPNDALKRWWERESPRIETQLRAVYRVPSLDEKTLRFFQAATAEAFRAGWSAYDATREPNDALKRWWERESPRIERQLRAAYLVASLDKKTLRFLLAATGEAFRAGWSARDAMERAQGKQTDLFGAGPDGDQE